MEALIFSLIVSLLFGFFTRTIAISKRQNATLSFWLGFFFPVIGLIVLALLPTRSPEEIAAARKAAAKAKARKSTKPAGSWYDTY